MAAGNDEASSTKPKKEETQQQASFTETLSFIFQCGPRETALFFLGCLGGLLNGLVYPALAFLFSNSFSDISLASENGLGPIQDLALTFFYVGLYALFCATLQSWSFEFLAYHAANNLRLQWFRALLRQDTAFFDIHDVGGIANQIGPASNKYRRGVGRKFGEGIQFLTTGIGGLIYALIASWKVALVVLSITPIVSLSALMVIQTNQTKGARAQAAYKSAGSVAYSSVSSIKTVLSLNAVGNMIHRYSEATQSAFHESTKVLVKQGFLNGSMLGSFMLLYCILTLFGSFLLYREVRSDGCDPSGAVPGNDTCSNSGPDVFGAMLGVAFAAQGISQFGNFSEAFVAARIAAYDALKAINRKPGAPEEMIYRSPEDDQDLGTTTHSKKSKDSAAKDDEEEPVLKAILPAYSIDSTSDGGRKLEHVDGRISFKNVKFSYPTRPLEVVLRGVSVDIEAGQTVAFVGPSGSGKSTIVGLVERFYDPQAGTIELDGVDLKELNVTNLRSILGYVGQEPTLFACSIKENIRYGKPDATMEEIEEAAKLANAHDFISSFADGYDTQVGDKGSQLSGGQKQRIAIARVLVSDPKLLILDEATSALDVESELVVQEALDNILQHKKITTIIIAHRLSTIRNCDIINVLVDGTIRETGSHGDLMELGGYYRTLVQKQEGGGGEPDSKGPSRSGSEANLVELGKKEIVSDGIPHISFKDVSFAYPTRPNKIVFDGFSLDVHRGSTVALVGASGGGKSTTVGLIERFYDPLSGTIEYNGVDLKALNVGWFRDKIGYVGQEPTLFSDTIANNIAFGYPGASQLQIEEAAKQANAHDFIMSFSEGYDTPVGERGTQISGGQKQRIAIARALVKKPEILLLDEATSALDNESESIVQAAIDSLMESRNQTCIVIAHRLSTIRHADTIAVVANGKVVESGSHDELVEKEGGRYHRLFASSRRDAKSITKKTGSDVSSKKDDEEINWEAQIEEEAAKAVSSMRALGLAAPDAGFILLGAISSMCAGAVFPLWGLFFSETINILFFPVFPCDDDAPPPNFDSCDDVWEFSADKMREDSFTTAGLWVLALTMCMVGFIGQFYGFGMASERLNKRIRDSTFSALLRQEVAYFDKQSVGFITSQLQDDAARIHAFSGEPLRAFLTATSSVVVGVTLAMIYMWQFALLALGCIPLMGFATSLEMQKMLGEDESEDDNADGKNTPGGVIVETLLNMKTVAALTLERQRYSDYENAIAKAEPNILYDTFLSGVTGGVSMFIQQSINALQFWFGGFLLDRFPETYVFKDFLIANFAILFSLFGLGGAFQDISDRKEVEKSAGRIFYLLDRKSAIDPLSDEGKRLDSAKPLSGIMPERALEKVVPEKSPDYVYPGDEPQQIWI